MNELFNSIVKWLQEMCQISGLAYEEINILIYTFLAPLSWWTIVWLRLHRRPWLWLPHLALPLIYYSQRALLFAWSMRFYRVNTEALYWLAGGNETSYIRLSIEIGVLIPLLIYLALTFCPKKLLFPAYIMVLLCNLAWYGWTWVRL